MKIWKYRNHEEYKSKQIEANLAKINNVWVEKSTIQKISGIQPNASKILCHGTRNGAEQKFFKEFYPDAEILGTEISPTAKNFPMTIEWDFHKDNPEWHNKFDIIYTNSLDHSIDPIQALTVWKNQLSSNGNLYLEYYFKVRSRSWDPLEISKDEIYNLFHEVKIDCNTSFPSRSSTGQISETFICCHASK